MTMLPTAAFAADGESTETGDSTTPEAAIYLDQQHGADDNDGLSKTTAVKTIEKANELANEKNINDICLSSFYKVTGTETWDLGGKTLHRYGLGGYMIELVSASASLTLSNIVIDGAECTVDATHAAETDSIIKAANGGTIVLNSGAILQNNKAMQFGSGILANNRVNITMEDGAIIRNNTNRNYELGGGILIGNSSTFTMNGGDLNITTYQGSGFSGNASGGWGGGMGGDGNSGKTDISAKGIKAVGLYDEAGTTWQSGGNLIVNGGTITIDSSDDSLHCGGDMQLLGGSMTLATADDGAHSDHALIIGSTGGDDDTPYVNITKSYEGIEGVDITQNSGTVMVTSSDDGYNAAGGSDSSGNNNNGGWGQGGWGGPGGGNSSNGSQTMTFNGGYTYVNAAGDGLDSNGNISFNGGYVFVSQTGGGNGPLDCGDSNNSITYSGGTVIAAGSSDMFETPSSYSFLSQTSVSAGQTITFTDASGNVLATFTLPNGSAEMVMCSKESSVTCYTGGTLSGTTYFASQDDTDRCGYGGTISGGTTVSASSGGSGGWGGGGNNRPF